MKNFNANFYLELKNLIRFLGLPKPVFSHNAQSFHQYLKTICILNSGKQISTASLINSTLTLGELKGKHLKSEAKTQIDILEIVLHAFAHLISSNNSTNSGEVDSFLIDLMVLHFLSVKLKRELNFDTKFLGKFLYDVYLADCAKGNYRADKRILYVMNKMQNNFTIQQTITGFKTRPIINGDSIVFYYNRTIVEFQAFCKKIYTRNFVDSLQMTFLSQTDY